MEKAKQPEKKPTTSKFKVKMSRLMQGLEPMLRFVRPVFRVIFHPAVRLGVEALVFLVLIGVVFAGTMPELPFAKDHQFLVVLSGSMEPTIKTGSIVLLNKGGAPYKKDDIITFVTPRTKQVTTHRVLSTKYDEKIKQNLYSTKGDANQDIDPWLLTDDQIVGKVRYWVPYLGYLVSYARTPTGFFVVAVVPGLLLIIDEIWKVKKVMQLEYEKKILKLKNELEEARHAKKNE